jgi:hypothetical protein
MSLGVRYYIGEINKGDTAELKAALRERDGVVPANEIASVEFTVQRPNGAVEAPVSGEIEDDGQGYLQYEPTTERGPYLAQAQFTLLNGEVRSVMVNFVVEDPFYVPPVTDEQLVAEEVWLRFEDSFDSMEGGPVLRDYTLANFDQKKIERFIPDALLDINVQMPPSQHKVSDFSHPEGMSPAWEELKSYVTGEEASENGVNFKALSDNADVKPNLHPETWEWIGPGKINELMPLLSKGVLCKTLQHLIRSYVEQPVPQGAQIAYEDRTRYAQAWQQVYQIEHDDWYTMVRLWKRQELNLGHSALLVSSKAGRLFFSGNILRSRNIGRGFF